MTSGLPQGGLLRRTGWGLVLLALVLAPVLGGVPVGEQYGGDVGLWALRITVLSGSLLVLSHRGTQVSGWARVTTWLLGGWALWNVVSLLVHSAFLTKPVLLFAMLPACIDALSVLGLMLSVRTLATDRGARPWLLPALLVGTGLTATMAVIQALENPPGFRATGPFFSPNFMAGYLGACLPLAAAVCLENRNRISAVLATGVVLLASAGVVSTGSRSGIVLAVAGTAVAAGLTAWRRKEKLPWRRVAALAAAIVVGAVITRSAVLERTAGGAQEHSGAFRSETWKGTLAMAAANPVVGTGPGTFASKYGPYARVAWTGQAHSSYLQVASETGFPALLLWTGTLLAGLGSAVRWLLRTERPHVAAGLCGGLAVVAARGLLDSETILLANLLPLAALLGLAAGGGVPASKWAWWSPLWAIPLGIAFVPLATTPSPGSDNAGWPPEPGRMAFRARLLEQQAIQAAGRGEDPSALRQQSRQALEDAARIEPVPRRFFARARFAEAEGDLYAAVVWFGKALEAEPTALQTLHALATAQERLGDRTAAKATWERLLAVDAGPAGRIKAIPELQDMWSIHAEAALAREGMARGDKAEAMRRWENAREGIRAYTGMPPLYQAMELERVPAGTPGSQAERVISRRTELRGILGEIRVAGLDIADLETALDAMDAEARRWAERTASAGSPP